MNIFRHCEERNDEAIPWYEDGDGFVALLQINH